MSTRSELNRLIAEKQKWMDLYDRCSRCLSDLDSEFGGRRESGGDACSRLVNMKNSLSGGGGFWQGPDAESFSRRLEELSAEIRNSEQDFRAAISKIQKKAEEETKEYNRRIKRCQEELDAIGRASQLADAVWDTFTGR